MDGDSLLDPLIIGTFEKRAPGPLMQGRSFRVVKKNLKRHFNFVFYFLQGSRTSPLLGIPISLNTSAVASFCRLLIPFIMLSFRLSNIYRSKDTKKYLLFIYRTSTSTIDVKRAYLDLYYAQGTVMRYACFDTTDLLER